MRIPISEIEVTFARSSGAGGQNVNKTSTKATARWNIGQSAVFNTEEKERIRGKLKNRINNNDELLVSAEEERSQPQNKARAIARLQNMVALAAKAPKKRRKTLPTRASKVNRLERKIRHSKTKAARRGFFNW